MATPVPTLSTRKFKVGMVSDVGGIDDGSFTENTWKGCQDAIAQLGIEAKFLEAQAQANSLIDEGADIIMGVGGKTGNGGIAAAKERGKWGIGVDMDQYYTLPNERDILITSTMKRLDKAVFSVIKNAMEGRFWGGTNYIATLENEGVGFAPFHDFEDKVPDNIKADLEQISQSIINGTIDTGWD